MLITPDPAALLAIASGVLLLALGVAALLPRPRTRASVALSALGLLWGAQVVAANLATVWTDLAGARLLALAFAALVIPIHLPILYLASVHPWRSNVLARSRGALALAAAPSAILLALLVLRPSDYVGETFTSPNGLTAWETGPAVLLVGAANTVLAFAAALGILVAKLPKAKSDAARLQIRLLILALAPYVAYRAAQVLATLLLDAPLYLELDGAPTYSLQVAMGAAAALAVAFALARAPFALGSRIERALLGLSLAAVAAGVGEVVAFRDGWVAFDTVGAWRFLLVGLLAYGVARHRLFDLDVRLPRIVPMGTFIAATVIGLEMLWNAFGPSFQGSIFYAMGATLGFELVVLSVSMRAKRRLAERAPAQSSLEARRLEVYGAALESAMVDGVMTPREEGILRELRRQLGVADDEHARLLAAARAA